MNSKVIGGILLIVGTTIGGGMLALPVSAAPGGFLYSTIMLFLCWIIMTFSALLILEVNLALPNDSNIISMAKATLGRKGEVIAWLSYIMLLYCLLAAYMSGGTDLLHNLLSLRGINLPLWLVSVIFVVLLGYIVYKGIQSVDYVNRGLMFTKLAAYLLLVISILPHVSHSNLQNGSMTGLLSSVTVMITSFGFATIIPSLRSYYKNDVKKLRSTVLVGSFIPLVCYILWIFVFLGVVPHDPNSTLRQAMQSGHTTTELTQSLSKYLNNTLITEFSRVFTSVCVLTSFLGVSLGLSDFLSDGFQIKKQGKGNLIIYSATFLPSLLLVIFDPEVFIQGLSYAGISCIILLVLLPAFMAWGGRYHKKLPKEYEVVGGKVSLVLVIIAGLAVIGLGFL